MAFYRIYRPSTLSQIDNEAVREQLSSLLSKDKKDLPHAYLFTGPKGAGKTTAARLIAKIYNCQKPDKNGAPCGKCDTCLEIAQARHLDVLELDAASNRGIDEIRQLRDTIALSPIQAAYKVYIIDEVHMLTTEAFNALLKTLEEPPPHAVFVLATTDAHKVPATIISRCIHIPFSKADQKALVNALSRIVKDEKMSIDEDALALIVNSADGAYRDAVKLLEQVSFHKGKITTDVVRDLLSVSEEQSLTKFIAALSKRDRVAALTIIGDLVKNGKDIKTFLVDCLHLLETMLLDEAMGKAASVPSGTDVKSLITRLTRAYTELRQSPIPQLPLELAVVEFCEENEIESVPVIAKSSQSQKKEPVPKVTLEKEQIEEKTLDPVVSPLSDLISLEKLVEHWPDVILAVKPFNHSVAGFLRSARPQDVKNGIVTIVAFYPFHQEKLAETKVRELLETVLKKLFGEKVKVEIELGKK